MIDLNAVADLRDEVPDICKGCKKSMATQFINSGGVFEIELCKYKNTIRELIKIANGDAGLKLHCNFREER